MALHVPDEALMAIAMPCSSDRCRLPNFHLQLGRGVEVWSWVLQEIHYNQHGLLLLQGQGIYRLANKW